MLYWNAKIAKCKYQKQSTRNKIKKKEKEKLVVKLKQNL